MVDTFFQYFLQKPLDLVIYVWVSAQKSIMPTITVEESIRACYRYFGLEQNGRRIDASQRQFTRTQARFHNSRKTKEK